MCIACIEYLKGTLTKREYENAYAEIVKTSEDPFNLEHEEAANIKYMFSEDENEYDGRGED
jgi:hypothetical protein